MDSKSHGWNNNTKKSDLFQKRESINDKIYNQD